MGPNGRVISEVIPDVERIIGPQPSVPPLGPAEAQQRFSFIFQTGGQRQVAQALARLTDRAVLSPRWG